MMQNGKFVPGRYQHAKSRGLVPDPEEAAENNTQKSKQREKQETEKINSGAHEESDRHVTVHKHPDGTGGHKFTVEHEGGSSDHDNLHDAVGAIGEALDEPEAISPKEESGMNSLGLQDEEPGSGEV